MALSHRTLPRTRPIALLLLAATSSLVIAGCSSGSVTISNGPCSGRSFTVTDDGTQLALDGPCGDVVVDADHVTLNIDSATSLVVRGDDATVIANKRLDELNLHGKADKVNGAEMGHVTVKGTRGEVIASRIDRLTVTGRENTVNWDSGVDAGTDTGTDNTLIYNGG
ncbi:MAG: DUF3060 domain-containing protein [Microbacterium sp.]|uniref:DUF3060 domain-containing protein n=1 Tax=Microbacterium sp. TaxID=51671 RepID=UPI001AD54A04|nr:DUF3060 domain-containing protein [Microbacterium sp.]MBN9152969.1 DUF3060 domain-containing protein [Microbacterium sp.]